jgi:hypothetical protein
VSVSWLLGYSRHQMPSGAGTSSRPVTQARVRFHTRSGVGIIHPCCDEVSAGPRDLASPRTAAVSSVLWTQTDCAG